MRLRIVHELVYRYDPPAKWAINALRLTPRGHDGQFVTGWRIEVDQDCRLEGSSDPFGNMVHAFTIAGPIDTLTVTAHGEVETQDLAGLVRGTRERFQPTVFLRDTPLTEPSAALGALARGAAEAAGPEPLARLHRLMTAIHERCAPAAAEDETAAATFAAKAGTVRGIAHAFIAGARLIGIPARYVSGYLHEPAADKAATGEHGWAEAHVPSIGWIGFDPSANLCPTDRYVRLAVGLDALGAAPARGAADGIVVSPSVRVGVADAAASKRQGTERSA